MKSIKIIGILLFLIAALSHQSPAKRIEVLRGQNLNEILNRAQGGDTVCVNAGEFKSIQLHNKKFSRNKPLVIKSGELQKPVIKGDRISAGSSLEITDCAFIYVEGLCFTNSMWGVYIKNSANIVLKKNEIFYTGQEGCHVGSSSKHVDIIENKIHHTGNYNSKWAEGIYIGSGSYSPNNFPDNCEYIWIEGNEIYETGNAEAINVKAESFHVTVRNNYVHNIHPGTSEQYNQAAISVDAAANSVKNKFRLNEKRDIWIENNKIEKVYDGYRDWNNGIMFFGTGVYILNNQISNCANRGIYGNNYENIGLENYVYGNEIVDCSEKISIHPELKVIFDAKTNPHKPQSWY